MEPLSTISKLYVVSTCVGSLFMVLSVALGRLPHGHGGTHHGGGHSGGHGGGAHGGGHTGQAGHAGHSGASGHAAATGPSHANSQIGHQSASAHARAHGHGVPQISHQANSAGVQGTQNGGASSNIGNNNQAQSMSLKVQTRGSHLHVGLEEHGFVEIILSFLNPLSIATFLAFFGVSGMILGVALHINAYITFALAVACGWGAVQAVIHLIGWLFSNMHVSTESKVADLVGQVAEVIVPITVGRTGEISYVVGSKRLTAPAKSLVPTTEFAKKTNVIICDIQNNVMMVDLWKEDFTNPFADQNKSI